jgi:phosphate transport system permease protein
MSLSPGEASKRMEDIQRQALIDQIGIRTLPQPQQKRSWRWWKDTLAGNGMALITLAACVLLMIVGGTLVYRAWPILSTRTPGALILSETWHPVNGEFGFRPFIVGSLCVTLMAMVLAVPAALFSAIYLSEYSTVRGLIKPFVDLLASIPSVIYGLWGVLFVVPLVRDHIAPWADRTLGQSIPFFANTNPTGYGILAAGFVLAIMVFPIIVSVTEEVLRSVPQGMREASLALGATEWETTKFVVMRKALPGVMAAVVLGFSRAFGETLAVLMVVGNVAKVPGSLFDAAYPLPALIANNYGEMMSIPLYDAALMLAALMLLVIVLVFNLGARLALGKVKQEAAAC